ncbi:MAG: hypothetical protein VKJ02_11900 [Snowella sp.]|nr:hypothetical protein [Snowella sp.]
MKQEYLSRLRTVWTNENPDYASLIKILAHLGYTPEFPSDSEYLRLWALVKAGYLLDEDVSEWEPLYLNKSQLLWDKNKHQSPSLP